jgi:hypothetical protein
LLESVRKSDDITVMSARFDHILFDHSMPSAIEEPFDLGEILLLEGAGHARLPLLDGIELKEGTVAYRDAGDDPVEKFLWCAGRQLLYDVGHLVSGVAQRAVEQMRVAM